MARGVAGRLQKRFVVLNSKELDARRMQYRSAEAKIAVELSSPLSPNVPTGPQNSPLAKLARKGRPFASHVWEPDEIADHPSHLGGDPGGPVEVLIGFPGG